MQLSKKVQELKWGKVHTYAYISFAIGMMLPGLIFGIAPLTLSWYVLPRQIEMLMLSWPYLFGMLGIAIYGPLLDFLGRKRSFYYSMLLYLIGGTILIFSFNYITVLLSLSILLLAGGGDMNSIMVAAHEIFPRVHRSKVMMTLMDFEVLSTVLLAIAGFFSFSQTSAFVKEVIAVIIFSALAVTMITRLKIPESVMWLEKKNMIEKAEEEMKKYDSPEIKENFNEVLADKVPPLWFKVVIIFLLSFANTAGFGILTYTLAPLYFPNLLPYIFLIAGLAGFLGGLLGLAGDTLSRKTLLMVSSSGTFAVSVIIWALAGVWTKDLDVFWALLVTFNVFVQWFYMTEDTLKGELWPTEKRGRLTALVRSISIGAYIPLLYFMSTLNIEEFLLVNVAVWLAGFAASLFWKVWGNETGKKISVFVASGESKSPTLPL